MSTKPPQMDWSAADLADEFKIFKQQMLLYFEDQEVKDEKKALKIKLAVGAEGLRRINSSSLTDAQQNDADRLWSHFENQLKIRVNFRVHRMEMMTYRMLPEESTDAFVRRCRLKGKSCDFTEEELTERILELVISSTPHEALQKDLLEKAAGYTLDQLIEEGGRYEAISASKKSLQRLENPAAVASATSSQDGCRRCGLHHHPRRCPAFKDTCKACGRKGHWAKKCENEKKKSHNRSPSSSRGQSRSRKPKKDKTMKE